MNRERAWTQLCEWTKTDAWAAQFRATVNADASATVSYRVRVTY